MGDPFEACAMLIDNRPCGQRRGDHLHTPGALCGNYSASRHHAFVPDVPAIAAALRQMRPSLSKDDAFDLIAAVAHD